MIPKFIEKKTCGLISCLIPTTLLAILTLHSPPPFLVNINRIRSPTINDPIFTSSPQSSASKEGESNVCDLFIGKWVFDPEFVPMYSNSSCKTVPLSKNCFENGRTDREFLQWRWKPEKCELPRFEPNVFFRIVSGKTMAFIGDSVARNQVDSLVCLLAQEEVPVDVYKDAKDRSRTWYFANHNFTLLVLWTKFLVASRERGLNGSPTGIFDLHIDKVDENWGNKLPTHLDYAVVSDAQWFFRKNYIYQNGQMRGCIHCKDELNIKELGDEFAIGGALRTALSHINSCKYCGDTLTLVRTISPSHFEYGTWKTGGSCNRTLPFKGRKEAEVVAASQGEWVVREAQTEEITRMKGRETEGKRYEVLDITEAMMLRPDGHPGSHWRSKQKKGYNDCVHWCMPGPIDAWNDLLLALLRNYHV